MPTQEELKLILRLVDETSGPLQKVQRYFADFKKNVEPEKSANQFKDLNKAVKGFGEDVMTFVEPAMAAFGLTTAGVAASMVGLSIAVTNYAKHKNDLTQMAAALDLTPQAMNRLDKAFSAADIPEATGNLSKLQTEFIALNEHVRPVIEQMARMKGGILQDLLPIAEARDFQGYLEKYVEIITRLQKEGDAPLAEHLAQEKFGVPAAKLQEAMKLFQQMQAQGVGGSPEDMARSKRVVEELQKVRLEWAKLYEGIMDDMLPTTIVVLRAFNWGLQNAKAVFEAIINLFPALRAAAEIAKLIAHYTGKKADEPDTEPHIEEPRKPGPRTMAQRVQDEADRDAARAARPKPPPFRTPEQVGTDIGKDIRQRFTTPTVPTVPATPAEPPKSVDDLIALPHTQRPRAMPPAVAAPAPAAPPAGLPPAAPAAPPAGLPQAAAPAPPAAPPIAPPAAPPAAAVPAPTAPPAAAADPNKQRVDQLLKLSSQPWNDQTAAAVQKLLETPRDQQIRVPDQAPAQPQQLRPPAAQAPPAAPVPVPAVPAQDSPSVDKLRASSFWSTPADARVVERQKATTERRDEHPDTVVMPQAPRSNGAELLDLLQQAPAAAPRLDSNALGANKVEGSATLKVDIAAPPGTRTAVNIAGIFDKTELRRRQAWQMEKSATNDGWFA